MKCTHGAARAARRATAHIDAECGRGKLSGFRFYLWSFCAVDFFLL